MLGTGIFQGVLQDYSTGETSVVYALWAACRTAGSISFDLVDEVTHIVSSFHIAGLTNVIGTLWEAEDDAGPKMAAEFYSTLVSVTAKL